MFLNCSESIATQVNLLISDHVSDDPIHMAVAFWGRGAEHLLSDPTSTFRVICNLHAGGTNPAVIRTIRSIPHVVVRQLDSLHAKVIAADCGAVISSANISTNGLGYDGPDTFTWHEAGVRVPSDSPEFQGILDWLRMLWGQARPITEKDLVAAEAAWARRKHTQCRSNKDNEEVGPHENPKSTLDLKTVHFHGRIKPDQRNIRSAAALLALDGHQGRAMPLTAFAFLFSGGHTDRAFKHHEDKFDIDHDQVSLKPEYVGYFIGEDGTLESCTDHKRRKSAGAKLLADTAAWMRGQGSRPVTLEGAEESASFDVRSGDSGAAQSVNSDLKILVPG